MQDPQDQKPESSQSAAEAAAAAAAVAAEAAASAAAANGDAANQPLAEGGDDNQSDPMASLAADLAAAQGKVQELQDAFLRAKADADNIRRRSQEDVAKAHKYGIENFAESLVPVMDSLHAALAVQNATLESYREGIEMTRKQLAAAFEKHRLLEIDPVGEKFDPHRHQAISMQPAGQVAPGHVISVLQKGYLIADRVLRPALVVVAQG